MPTILEEAQSLVHGDRGKSYGLPLDDFSRTAGMLTAAFKDLLKPGACFLPEHVAYIQIMVKISRAMNGLKRDHHVDIAGYAETAQMVVEEREKRAKNG
jgi:hypothetical protein